MRIVQVFPRIDMASHHRTTISSMGSFCRAKKTLHRRRFRIK